LREKVSFYVDSISGVTSQNTADMQYDLYARRIDFVPALSILREYSAPNMQVQYAGTDTINGSPVDVVALSFMPPGLLPGTDGYAATQRLFYIDQSTSLVLKVQFTTVFDPSSNSGPKTETYFSNIR
jgi:hypothetical protein